MTDQRFNSQTGHGIECLCDECLLWVVPAAIHKMMTARARPYIVAGWAVKPEDRAWREDRTRVTYRVTQ